MSQVSALTNGRSFLAMPWFPSVKWELSKLFQPCDRAHGGEMLIIASYLYFYAVPNQQCLLVLLEDILLNKKSV